MINCVDVSLFYKKIDERDALRVPKDGVHNFLSRRYSLRKFSTFARPSLEGFLHSYTWSCVLLPNCALNLNRISAGFTFSLVIILTVMLCVIAKGAAGSLIAITTNKKQVDTQ